MIDLASCINLTELSSILLVFDGSNCPVVAVDDWIVLKLLFWSLLGTFRTILLPVEAIIKPAIAFELFNKLKVGLVILEAVGVGNKRPEFKFAACISLLIRLGFDLLRCILLDKVAFDWSKL